MSVKHLQGLALLMLSLVLNSCLDKQSGIIALPTSSDGEVDERVIPAEIRTTFSSYVNLYEGTTPPTITGCYEITPMTTVYCSDERGYEPGHVINDMKVYFGEQTNRGIILEYKEQENSSTAVANNVQITGYGPYFTAYFINYGTGNDGVTTTKQSTVISGELTSNGIRNIQYAFIMLEKNDPYDKMMPVNAYRVFKDGDGMAYNTYDFYAPARRTSQVDKGNANSNVQSK